jgi:hypothetical protein
LLSIVAPAFALVVFYLCAGEDRPPLSFGDADKSCQWEVQIDEGWVSYRDSHA